MASSIRPNEVIECGAGCVEHRFVQQAVTDDVVLEHFYNEGGHGEEVQEAQDVRFAVRLLRTKSARYTQENVYQQYLQTNGVLTPIAGAAVKIARYKRKDKLIVARSTLVQKEVPLRNKPEDLSEVQSKFGMVVINLLDGAEGIIPGMYFAKMVCDAQSKAYYVSKDRAVIPL